MAVWNVVGYTHTATTTTKLVAQCWWSGAKNFSDTTKCCDELQLCSMRAARIHDWLLLMLMLQWSRHRFCWCILVLLTRLANLLKTIGDLWFSTDFPSETMERLGVSVGRARRVIIENYPICVVHLHIPDIEAKSCAKPKDIDLARKIASS